MERKDDITKRQANILAFIESQDRYLTNQEIATEFNISRSIAGEEVLKLSFVERIKRHSRLSISVLNPLTDEERKHFDLPTVERCEHCKQVIQ